ncbi:hypothetical protein COY28_00725 [Candidatus Woesearchaeota archaeon CG_4_10_14_0_2_um_filter_57_5]|nr:MAG: hypothetical protein AUJ68_06465 [Candidatus Woesearchaeota archaeon CG1_02_57_44]PIZ56777.1 MAG: hypothetical protein COY28_00725 [Candidatus Woesearchaeota archaeon CG_4_10_14_0_2_um_filter_57_5]
MHLESRFVVMEYDSSRVDPGPALALFHVKDAQLVMAYDPRTHPCTQPDIGECRAVRQYLHEHQASEVFSPRPVIPMPESILGLTLDFDNEWEWGLYRPLGTHYWAEFFAEADIQLREFDPSVF